MSNIIFNSGVKFPSLIIPTGSQPLDSRTIVQNLPLYSCEFTEGAVYLGMPVSCLADNNFYTLKSLSTDKFIVVIYKGKWELLSEVEKLDEYKALSVNDKKVITDTKVENVSKLEWQQVGKETDLSNYDTSSQVNTKISNAIKELDSSHEAPTAHYITGITQTDGKITSITYTNLPSTTNGKLTGNMGTAYTWDNTTSTHTSAPIKVEISYSNGAITNIGVTGLDDVATKDFIDGKLSYEISKLDSSDAAKTGYYVSYVSQADGKISVGREKLPTVEFPEGTYKGNLGMTYIGVGTNGTPTYTDIPVTISYKDGKVTGVGLSSLDSFVKKQYVDEKVSYEISSHNLVDKDYVDGKYDALLGDGKLNDTIDTIKEISYWLDNNPDDAVELTLSLAELTEKVKANETTVATDLNEIHTQLDNRYTKSEIDNTLTSYAKSANVYTKTEVNNTLASYASISYVNTRLSWGVI
jgi:hypothetical protein